MNGVFCISKTVVGLKVLSVAIACLLIFHVMGVSLNNKNSEYMKKCVLGEANIAKLVGTPQEKELKYLLEYFSNNIKTVINPEEKVHVVTAANDEYLVGVIGLIKSTFRRSLNPGSIQFEVFLTPDQNASLIENLKHSKNGDKWSINIHRFTEKEVEPYVNKKFNQKSCNAAFCNARSNLKNAHNWVRYILFQRLRDVKYCLWVDADVSAHKDVVQFVMETTRTRSEQDELQNDIQKSQTVNLYGKTFREKYVIGAPPNCEICPKPNGYGGFLKKVYNTLRKYKFKPQDKPHFNAGFIIINLDLWRKKKINEDMLRITEVNNKHALWTDLGSQAPLTILLGGKNFFQLPIEVLELTLGFRNKTEPKKGTYFLHWNGVHKPWKTDGLNKHLWEF